MKRKTKWVLNGGLAFSENKDMKKLSDYSNKGWHVKGFKGGGFFYELERGEPTDYIYTIDYRGFTEEEFNEYQDIINDSGWELVQNYTGILILRAVAGTAPIYSDESSFKEREHYSGQEMWKSLLVFLKIIAVLLAYRIFIHSVLGFDVWLILDLIIAGLIGFTATAYVGYLLKRHKAKKSIN